MERPELPKMVNARLSPCHPGLTPSPRSSSLPHSYSPQRDVWSKCVLSRRCLGGRCQINCNVGVRTRGCEWSLVRGFPTTEAGVTLHTGIDLPSMAM